MANTKGEKELKQNWPITEGLTAGTTKQAGRVMNLQPQGCNGVKTIVEQKDREGL